MTQLLHVARAFTLCLTLFASDAFGKWNVVADFSTAEICRGVEGVTFHAETQTLMAVSGNRIFQLTTSGRLLGSYLLQENPSPRLRGIHGLPSGNLLLVAENTHRLYEVTVAGRCIETKPIEPGIAPRGVTYSVEQGSVFVADRANKSLKRFVGGQYVDQTNALRVSDIQGVEVAGPGAFLILDNIQKMVFHYSAGGELREFIDLTRVCEYEEPDGLALDRQRGVLYICFDESERIVGVDVSGALGRSAPQTREGQSQIQTPTDAVRVQTPTSQTQVQIPQELFQRALVQIQQQQAKLAGPPAEQLPLPAEPLPAEPLPAEQVAPLAPPSTQVAEPPNASSAVVIPSPYPPTQIVVRPQSPTIYILPIIIGNPGSTGYNTVPAGPGTAYSLPANSSPPYSRPAYRIPTGPACECCLPSRW